VYWGIKLDEQLTSEESQAVKSVIDAEILSPQDIMPPGQSKVGLSTDYSESPNTGGGASKRGKYPIRIIPYTAAIIVLAIFLAYTAITPAPQQGNANAPDITTSTTLTPTVTLMPIKPLEAPSDKILKEETDDCRIRPNDDVCVIRKAVNLYDPDVCKYSKNRENCITLMAIRLKKQEVCTNMNDEPSHLLSCYSAVSQLMRNPSICDELPEKIPYWLASNCRMEYLMAYRFYNGSWPNDAMDICTAIQEPSVSSYCLAAVKSDISYCTSIDATLFGEGKWLKPRCEECAKSAAKCISMTQYIIKAK
jgi:hypothetical protein